MNLVKLWPLIFGLGIATSATSLTAQPLLNIDRTTGTGPVRLSWEGEADFEYRLEETSALDPSGPWNFVAKLASPGSQLGWSDAKSRQVAQRFYRAVQSPLAPNELAPDFRLNDQL